MIYLLQLENSLPEVDPDAQLFHQPSKRGYANFPIGPNMLGRIGMAFAEELGLLNPEKYSGNCCFRGKATTVDTNHGTPSFHLKGQTKDVRYHHWHLNLLKKQCQAQHGQYIRNLIRINKTSRNQRNIRSLSAEGASSDPQVVTSASSAPLVPSRESVVQVPQSAVCVKDGQTITAMAIGTLVSITCHPNPIAD